MDMTMFRRRGLLLNTPHIVNESGSIVTFNSAYNKVLIKSLICNIEPIQEGTGDPSPDNIRPISGRTGLSVVRTGKNLLKNTGTTQTTNGVTFTVNDDGTISTTGVATGTAVFRIYVSITDLPKADGFIMNGCPAGGDYDTKYSMILANIGGATLGLIDTGNGATFTASSLKALAQLQIIIRTGTDANGLVFKPMIRVASNTDPTFVPYQGRAVTVDLGSTIYGGTLDAISGKLNIDGVLKTFDGATSEGWTYTSSALYPYFYCKLGSLNSGIDSKIVCDTFPNNGQISASNDTQGIYVFNSASYNGLLLYLRWDALGFSTVTELSNWLSTNNVTVCYKLATPTEIQLTPQEVRTLLGENNIWCDSGDVTVDYWKWGN